MRPVAATVLLAALSDPLAAESTLEALAARFAEQIVSEAGGRAVQMDPPEDRTGRGPTLALDLTALVVARLTGRVPLRAEGARLRVAAVVAETPRRVVLSARLVEEPGGRLVRLLSVSAPTDPALLGLFPARSAAPGPLLEVASSVRTPPIEGPVLDLAFVGEARLAVLAPDGLSVYRWEPQGLALESRHALESPLGVRRSAGLLRPVVEESSLWVLTNRSARAVLFGLTEGRLQRHAEAPALPWPGSAAGLSYRPGTDLIEGRFDDLGDGPFLDVLDHRGSWAVGPDGILRTGTTASVGPTSAELRVGPTLAPLWDGLLVASSAAPPGDDDALVILNRREEGVERVETVSLAGAVRALATRVEPGAARLVAGIEEPDGGARLVLMELRRREP